MKKHVIMAAGLAVLSTSAYATKARMEALGQDTVRGSFYIMDSRNLFGNAAVLNDMKNFVVTEWGGGGNGSTTASSVTEGNKPQGGFFREAGSFSYGVYLGNEDEDKYASTRTTGNFLNQDNVIDLFFAGDMGVQWGARLHYANSSDEQTNAFEKTANTLGVGLGMKMGNLGLELVVDLNDESKGDNAAAANKWEGDTAIDFEVTYTMGALTGYGNFVKNGYETTVSGVKTDKQEDQEILLGVGHIHEVTSTSKVFTDVQLAITEAKNTQGATITETNNTYLPITIGFESEANSWLTLRGSIKQNVILGSTENLAGKKKSIANSTDVAAGATLNFGKLKVDGVIGTDDANNNQESGVLRTDRLMSRVAVHYWF